MGTPVLVISGSLGSGKTTVLGECDDILRERGVSHAAVDLDALGQLYPVPTEHPMAENVSWHNLAAVWRTFEDMGIARLLVASVVEHEGEVEEFVDAIPGAELQICLLTASVGTMRARLRVREPGRIQAHHLRRAAELDEILDHAGVEHFRVANDGRAIGAVAEEVLSKAGWI